MREVFFYIVNEAVDMLGHRRRGAFRVAILNGPQDACVVRHRFGELSADVRELKIGMSLGHDQFDDLGEDSIAGDFAIRL